VHILDGLIGGRAARATEIAEPLLPPDTIEALADLLRRVVWADKGPDQPNGAPDLADLLAGRLGATINAARLELGTTLVQLLGNLTAHGDSAAATAAQRSQLLSTTLGALTRVGII